MLDKITRGQRGDSGEGLLERMDETEPLRLADNELPSTEEDGTIVSGAISGGLNPSEERAERHAIRYYKFVQKMKADISKIAKNTGYSPKQIQQIKNHLFLDEHDLGGGRIARFDPCYEIAQSWQRLLDGKRIQPHDLTLLRHELMEIELMNRGYTQEEAHKITSMKYNYKRECDEYYGEVEGHS